ncbi:RNA polymerase sigma factor (sigma-70 family) [Paenibacillus taihuensis]|uniref:RNA polymerase sigma factor (Sigma-70 family) n=1 Tax=Paenibacillus taihuensis TaxID=1156355 RepID=A0A3D9S6Z2_9BACL|nr:sigma-70 family RNA polymerase sigma factor [Paenibacillus taihuensis]REE88927.1 RNA polymerase sigma factor (sigma-70 family) [Paenibacillus taihuensis]
MAGKKEDEQQKQLEFEQDEVLTVLARSGDASAFNELVRRHRLKAFTWASRISKDPHLSEDIVQEALIRAFLNLNSLAHNHRFLGWFKSIVRNQALMKMRRGGLYRRELPATALQTASMHQASVQVDDINSIMDYLIARSSQAENDGTSKDPQVLLERREWYGIIRAFLRVLTPREKSIFESFFFQECSPQEIAQLFQISVGNVYKIISRSRQKVQEERLSFLIRAQIRQRREDGLLKQNVLDPVSLKESGGSLLTGTEQLYRFVKARHPQLSLSYVDGMLLGAFLLNIEKSSVDMSSTNMIDRNYLITNGMLNLGMRVRYVEAFDFEPPDPNLTTEGIALAQGSVDLGMPAMVWELIHSEFGLIYGYDDMKQQFYGLDTQSDEMVPYEQLGRLQTRSLFVLGFVGDHPISPSDSLWRWCQMISRHARGQDQTFSGFVNGLAAYDTWMDVIRQRAIEPLGHAYTINVLRQSRKHAMICLAELVSEWGEVKSESEINQTIFNLLNKAEEQYAIVHDRYVELALLFPVPSGGEPNEPANAARAIELIKHIKYAEQLGIEWIEQIAERLEEHASRAHVPAIVENPPRAYIM